MWVRVNFYGAIVPAGFRWLEEATLSVASFTDTVDNVGLHYQTLNSCCVYSVYLRVRRCPEDIS